MRNPLAVYDPMNGIDGLERAFFDSPFFNMKMPAMPKFSIDITDEGDSYKLTADLPGFSKDDIKIDIDGKTLTLSAERHSEFEEKDKKGKYIRAERSYGSFSRSFNLEGVKADDITASYENGILTLELPKEEKEKSEKKKIEIK